MKRTLTLTTLFIIFACLSISGLFFGGAGNASSAASLVSPTNPVKVLATPVEPVPVIGSFSAGNCLPRTATKIEDPGDTAILNAPGGELISVVSIKAGTECFITPANATGTIRFGDCYVIEGLATEEVTVRRIGAGPQCKDISHIEFLTAPASELRLCKVAGAGIDVGTPFTFTAGNRTVVVSAGPEPAGSCAFAGMFPAGNQVAVSETIPAGVEAGSIACAGGAACSPADLAAGTVTVTIGAGGNEVTYTNQRTEPASPELCGDGLDNDRDGIVDDGCIGGRAWRDHNFNGFGHNFNGIQDAGEPGIAGVTFILRTSEGTLVATTVSDANGRYHFSDVAAGTYFVQTVAPFALTLTGNDRGTDDTLDSDIGGAAATGWRTPDFAFPVDGSISHLDAGFIFAND